MNEAIPRPTDLRREGDNAICIQWSDGEMRHYTARELRSACPCAMCKHKAEEQSDPMALPVLTPQELKPLTITGMAPQGNYAYLITFSDGHQTGIFSLRLLRELGTVRSS